MKRPLELEAHGPGPLPSPAQVWEVQHVRSPTRKPASVLPMPETLPFSRARRPTRDWAPERRPYPAFRPKPAASEVAHSSLHRRQDWRSARLLTEKAPPRPHGKRRPVIVLSLNANPAAANPAAVNPATANPGTTNPASPTLAKPWPGAGSGAGARSVVAHRQGKARVK